MSHGVDTELPESKYSICTIKILISILLNIFLFIAMFKNLHLKSMNSTIINLKLA